VPAKRVARLLAGRTSGHRGRTRAEGEPGAGGSVIGPRGGGTGVGHVARPWGPRASCRREDRSIPQPVALRTRPLTWQDRRTRRRHPETLSFPRPRRTGWRAPSSSCAWRARAPRPPTGRHRRRPTRAASSRSARAEDAAAPCNRGPRTRSRGVEDNAGLHGPGSYVVAIASHLDRLFPATTDSLPPFTLPSRSLHAPSFLRFSFLDPAVLSRPRI
jgi:hypothetical protein